jgi:riboflavin synthase
MKRPLKLHLGSEDLQRFAVESRLSLQPMFTGIIEQVANVIGLRAADRGYTLQIAAPGLIPNVAIGDSIAVNGCCLTVSTRENEQLGFDLLNETIERTNLKNVRRDSLVNLERALRADGRLGGHFIQGHIDCTARIAGFKKTGADYRLEIELPAQFAHYIAAKGSIAVDGISLTVAELLPKSFLLWIIPHTKAHTNLDQANAGDLVNLEFDILAKYVERALHHQPPK